VGRSRIRFIIPLKAGLLPGGGARRGPRRRTGQPAPMW